MSTIAGSVSPQTKAHVANAITGSSGLATLMEWLPSLTGSIATIVAIIASVVLTYKALKQLRMSEERHVLEMRKLTNELERSK